MLFAENWRCAVFFVKNRRTHILTHFKSYQGKVAGKNINSQTLLATDYLNHFNEVHMLMDMLPSMPDCLEDICQWAPKSYQEHFRDSVFTEKELAIEAYAHSPDEYREPFERTVGRMNDLVQQTVSRVEQAIARNDTDKLQRIIDGYSPQMIALIEKCGAIINGEKHMTHQDSIDDYFAGNEDKLDGEDLAQSAIDDLFG